MVAAALELLTQGAAWLLQGWPVRQALTTALHRSAAFQDAEGPRQGAFAVHQASRPLADASVEEAAHRRRPRVPRQRSGLTLKESPDAPDHDLECCAFRRRVARG